MIFIESEVILLKATKQIYHYLAIAIGIFIIFILYHALNKYFPGNIIHRAVQGIAIVLTPALIALVITYLISPFTNFLIHRLKWKKNWAIAVTLIVVFLAIGGIVSFVSLFLIEQGKALYQAIQETNFFLDLENWFAGYGLEEVYVYLEDYIVNFDFTILFSSAGSVFSMIFQALATIVLIPVFLYHFLYSKNQIFEGVLYVLPDRWHQHVKPIAQESNIMIMQYFKSKLISICFLFVVFAIFYTVLGMPVGYVLLFAILISVLDLIPYLGPTIANIIPIVYVLSVGGTNILYIDSLFVGSFSTIAILLIGNFVIQAIQGNIIMPKLAGKEMNINSLLILVSMLFFGSILGVWGIVLSIPLCGFLMILLRYLKSIDAVPTLEEDSTSK